MPRLAEAPAAAVGPSAESLQRLEGLRIAVLDDNQALCELVVDQISALGCIGEPFTDPARFLAAAATTAYDAVILDWIMPGMGGAQVLARLADPRRSRPLPVLITSGGEPDAIAQHPGVRIIGTLAKPYRQQTLLLRLAEGVG